MVNQVIQDIRAYFIMWDYNHFITDRSSIRDAAIMHDLGLYGDDIDLELFSFLMYEIDIPIVEIEAVLGCDIMDYFRPEFLRPRWNLLKWFQASRFKSYPRLTIGMFEDAVNQVLINRARNNPVEEARNSVNRKIRRFFIAEQKKYKILIAYYDDFIIREDSIMHDFNLYRDDIKAVLIPFLEREFDISITELNQALGCDIMRYFRPKIGLDQSLIEKYPRFTIGMLEDAVNQVLIDKNAD